MDMGLQIWYTEYVGVQMGTAFWRLPFFIACVPDKTLSDLPLPHPAAWISSLPGSHPPMPAGDGCRRTSRSPEFSATRLWRRLAAEHRGFNSHLNQLRFHSLADVRQLRQLSHPQYLLFVPLGFRAVLFLPASRRCAPSSLTTVYRKYCAGAIHMQPALFGTVHKCCVGTMALQRGMAWAFLCFIQSLKNRILSFGVIPANNLLKLALVSSCPPKDTFSSSQSGK